MPAHSYGALLLTGLVIAGGCGLTGRPGATTGAELPFEEPAAAGRRGDAIRIATFNAEFLFDGEGNEGGVDFPWKGDTTAARIHRQAVSRVVRSLDADVVVLIEVENLAILRTMIVRDLAGMRYAPSFIEGQDTYTGQDVGILSRIPIDTTFRTDERVAVAGTAATSGVSKNLIVRFDIDGAPVSLIALHLLAQPVNAERRPMREAQAEVVRRAVVREAAAGREVIVAGDFNDFDDAVQDVRGSRAISTVLRTIRSAGPGRRDDLRDALSDVPRRERYTVGRDRDGDGRLERHELAAVDHVLLSGPLHRRLRSARVVHANDAQRASDHWPVAVTLGGD